jgi:hypothetical protein
MRIYGAGLAGLLAANMLRRFSPVIHESQASLPNNHEALLRFRSDAVARVTGIPFKKVLVHKAILWEDRLITKPDLRLSNMYAQKVTGEVISRSILNLDPVERYIAPPNLIELMAKGVDIEYNSQWAGPSPHETPCISTIPMPALMKMARWDTLVEFNYRTITIATADIAGPKVEVYQTLYNPNPHDNWYRTSITGNHVILELIGDYPNYHVESALGRRLVEFGIRDFILVNPNVKVQRYGKIAPIHEQVRKEFIVGMSDVYGVYSLGRYATWRNILLDDVVHDVNVIDSFMTQRSSYQRSLIKASLERKQS